MAQNEYKELTEKIKKILEELLNTGDWQDSLFLRTAHKKLQDLYDRAAALSAEFNAQTTSNSIGEMLRKEKQGYIKVYVSLYQSDPFNLIKWENTLKTIKEQSINRPIYKAEEYIQEMIRSKQSPNESYAIIYIQSTDIIPPYTGKIVSDRWGHELLTLRDNSLVPENIIEFVHQNRRYLFRNGKLILKSS